MMPEFFLIKRFFLVAALFLAGLPVAPANAAATKGELEERVRRSGVVFQEMKNAPDRELPADLLARSRCVAVVPNVIKAAWVLGGRFGTGVLSCRSTKGEWSPPVFVMMTGGSFGLQFGASSTDVVLFFMTTEGLRSVLNNKVKLSGDVGVAAGPVGREAEAATDGKFNAQIYSYARSRGLFAGVSLSGAYLGVNVEDTRSYYGKSYSTTGILFEGKVASVPKSTWAFLGALPPSRTAAAKLPATKSKNAKATAPKSVSKTASKSSGTASKSSSTTAKSGSTTAKAPAKTGPETAATASLGSEASGTASAFGGEASGTAVNGGDAWGTAAAGSDTLGGEASDTLGGEASGTAAAGEASGTAAAPPAASPPVR